MRSRAPPPPVPHQAGSRPTAPPAPAGGWRETSTTCPPGLHSLMHLDRIHVDRATESSEWLDPYYASKMYKVVDGTGTQELYTAIEESSSCGRCCLGKHRGWDFHILDQHRREVMRMSHEENACCGPCLENKKVIVYSSNGQRLGSVVQNWSAIRPSFDIVDSNGQKVLYIKGPFNTVHFFNGDVNFKIKSIDREHNVGVMSKKWPGFLRNMFEMGHSFDISFPPDLDVKIKAVLIGACFLFDFVYFEEQENINRLSKIE